MTKTLRRLSMIATSIVIACSVSSCREVDESLSAQEVTRHGRDDIVYLERYIFGPSSTRDYKTLESDSYQQFYDAINVRYTKADRFEASRTKKQAAYLAVFKDDKYHFIFGFTDDLRLCIQDWSKLQGCYFISVKPVDTTKFPFFQI